MILQLITTNLLLLGSGGGYQVAYNQNDTVSGIVDSYDINQRAVIDNDSGNLELTYTITSGDYGTFTIAGDIDTVEIDTYIDLIPSYLDFLPLFWFTFEYGQFIPINDNDLGIYFEVSSSGTYSIQCETINYGHLSLYSHVGAGVDDAFYYNDEFEYIYYDIAGLLYSNIFEENDFTYYNYDIYLDVDDWTITGDNFSDLDLDLYFSIGNYKRLKEMSYSVNGLGSKVEQIYQQGYQNGASTNDAYYVGQESVLQDPNAFDLYTENQYTQNYQQGYENGKLDAETPVGLDWFKASVNVFFSFLNFMILPGVTLGNIVSGILILMILKFVLDWFRG